ncbi:MAG: hypothetical protein IJZ64_01280 [Ruminococcus sp.]|nr:hypothetical protein [Ruminococcus sp.]
MGEKEKKLPTEFEQLLIEICDKHNVDFEQAKFLVFKTMKLIVDEFSEILNQVQFK